MTNQNIKCPNCGTEIELTEALTGQIERDIRLKYQAEALEKEKEVRVKLDEIGRKAKVLEQEKLGIDEQVTQRVSAEKLKLFELKKSLEGQRLAIDEKVADTLKAERKGIAEVERKKALAEQAEANKALQDELAEKAGKLAEANKKELELLKRQRELAEKAENIELEIERKMAVERKKIAAEAADKASAEQLLKMREKDDLIKAMQDQVENLKRRAELGSQEAQGEALEVELKELLEREFPFDRIEEVKKGARGADVVQVVHNSSGKECGKILWESKNTKEFQKLWIEKLKKDQQQAQAEIAVLMSVALPGDVKSFGLYEDIWVCDYKSAAGLACALRQGVIEANRQKAITAGRDSIKDVIYNYVTSREFALHISSVVDSYKQMQEDLESEKRAMGRIWKKREKQIVTVLDNVSGLYGSIEGIVGSQKTLGAIDGMELGAIGEE